MTVAHSYDAYLAAKHPPFRGGRGGSLRAKRRPYRASRFCEPTPLTKAARDIVCAVLATSYVTLDEVLSQDRSRRVCAMRDEAMAALRACRRPDGTPMRSLNQIGRFFGRDHSTVCVALQRHNARRSRDGRA